MRIRRLRSTDDRSEFSCGDLGMDRFLRQFAQPNQDILGIGVTYVLAAEDRVFAYSTLAAGSLRRDSLPAELAERLPAYPLPILRLARLAVDETVQRRGVGSRLTAHAFAVAVEMRARTGCMGLVVDALPSAVEFYSRLGFVRLDVLEGASRARPRPTPMFRELWETNG